MSSSQLNNSLSIGNHYKIEKCLQRISLKKRENVTLSPISLVLILFLPFFFFLLSWPLSETVFTFISSGFRPCVEILLVVYVGQDVLSWPLSSFRAIIRSPHTTLGGIGACT